MKRSPELTPSKYDLLVVAAVLALAVCLGARFWGGLNAAPVQNGGLSVVIEIDGTEVERTQLRAYSGQHIYTSNGYTLTVESADGWVDVTRADCPTQDCKHSGAIKRAGQSIVCLPARIVITLVGTTADYDVIAG